MLEASRLNPTLIPWDRGKVECDREGARGRIEREVEGIRKGSAKDTMR